MVWNSVILKVKPVGVINCIGIVKQRDEAKAAIPSIRVNALFPHLLAEMCEEYRRTAHSFIH